MEKSSYDVVVMNGDTVDYIAMRRLQLSDGYYNARRWRNTLEARLRKINHRGSVLIVRNKRFGRGDTVPESERVT